MSVGNASSNHSFSGDMLVFREYLISYVLKIYEFCGSSKDTFPGAERKVAFSGSPLPKAYLETIQVVTIASAEDHPKIHISQQ